MLILSETFQVNIAGPTVDAISHWAQEIGTALAHKAGGFTRWAAGGGWVSEQTGTLYVDEVWVIQARTNDAEALFQAVLPVIAEYAVALEQEAVYVEINGEARIYDTPELVALVAASTDQPEQA